MYFDISEETRLNDELINTEQNILRVYVSRTPVALPRKDYLRHRVDSDRGHGSSRFREG